MLGPLTLRSPLNSEQELDTVWLRSQFNTLVFNYFQSSTFFLHFRPPADSSKSLRQKDQSSNREGTPDRTSHAPQLLSSGLHLCRRRAETMFRLPVSCVLCLVCWCCVLCCVHCAGLPPCQTRARWSSPALSPLASTPALSAASSGPQPPAWESMQNRFPKATPKGKRRPKSTFLLHQHTEARRKTKVILQQLPTAARAAALSMCVGLSAVGGIRSDHHVDSPAAQRSPDRLPAVVGPTAAWRQLARPLLDAPSAVPLGVIPAPRMLLGCIRGRRCWTAFPAMLSPGMLPAALPAALPGGIRLNAVRRTRVRTQFDGRKFVQLWLALIDEFRKR